MLQIETMSACNMKCRFCAYFLRKDKSSVLSDEAVYSVIDSIYVDDAFEYLCFNQLNEPLLDNRIFGFIKYAKSRNIPVQIVTNGILFGAEDVICKLIDTAPDYIKISLQTLNPELFKTARGIGSSFEEYKNGIFKFLKSASGSPIKIFVDIACNFITPIKLIRSVLFGLELGDPSVYNSINDLKRDMKMFLEELQKYDDCFVFDKQEIDNYLKYVKSDYLGDSGFKICENIFIKIKPFFYGRRLTDFYPVKNSVGCANKILSVLASGNVVPCCLAYDDILCMGNIKKEPIEIILERNANLLYRIKSGENLPLYCGRCMGAPSRYAIPFKELKTFLAKKLNRTTFQVKRAVELKK